MHITRGSSRIVLVVGTLVFKAPLFFFSFRNFGRLLKLLLQGNWRDFKHEMKFFYHYRLRGAILQNWSEFRTWRNVRAEFLAPTYFSCGILNIQKYIQGEKPTAKQTREEFWRHLSEKASQDICTTNTHCLMARNFVRNKEGFVFVDYGDELGILESFLSRHKDELTKIFTQKITSNSHPQ